MPVESVGLDVRVKFGDSTLNRGPNYSTRCWLVPFYPLTRNLQPTGSSWPRHVGHHSAQYLIAFCSRPEAASDDIFSANVWQVGMDVLVKFGHSS